MRANKHTPSNIQTYPKQKKNLIIYFRLTRHVSSDLPANCFFVQLNLELKIEEKKNLFVLKILLSINRQLN